MPKNFPGIVPTSTLSTAEIARIDLTWTGTWDLGSCGNVAFTKLELGRTQLEKKGSVIVLGGGREPLFGPIG